MSLITFWLVSSQLHQAVNLPAEEHDAVAADTVAYIVRAKRNARKGRNPQTGKEIQIKAHWVPRFRPGQEFKEYVR